MMAGLDVLQLDEPAFNVYMDDVAGWGIEALHRATEGLACTTAVHICYGYGIKADIDWKQTLGREWRQYEQTFPLLAQSRIDQVHSSARIPACRSHCWACSPARMCSSAASTWRARPSRHPTRWRRRSGRRSNT